MESNPIELQTIIGNYTIGIHFRPLNFTLI